MNRQDSTLQSDINPSHTAQNQKLARTSLVLGIINFLWPVLLFFSYGPASGRERVYLGGDSWRYSNAQGSRIYQAILITSLVAVIVLGITGLAVGVMARLKTRSRPSLYGGKRQAAIGITLNLIFMIGTMFLLLFLMSTVCC